MRRLTRGCGGTRGVLLGLSLLLVTGHVCVLPLDGHAASTAIPTHADHSHDAGEGDAAHRGSCEALRSSWVGAPTIVLSAVPLVAAAGEPCRRWIGRGDVLPSATTSPPLFLLHAALLI